MRKEIPMSDVANQVATKRYYAKDSKGNCTEDWSGLVSRVVTYVCGKESGEYKEKISNLMLRREFLPNSPCLVNAGNNVGGLLACQPGWVRINTDKGLFRIQDIVEFDGDFELQTFFGPAKINKRWCNGKKEVFRYETEKGYRLDCTLDHRVYAVRDYSKKKHLARASLLKNHTEWVRAEDLRLGDALVLDFSEKRFSEDYVKVSVKNSVSTIVVDEDLARIIAYAKCDGHLAYHQSGPKAFGNTTLVFELIVDSPQALDLIRKSKYIHGNEISISNTDGNEHLKRIRAYGKSYAPLLALGEYGSLTCDIPDFIFHSPKSVVRSFIQAAFECEGTLSFGLSSKTGKRIGHIAIGMTSEDFIRDLQRLLNMFGIQSSISGPVRDKRTDFQRNPMFYLSITNAVHMARFMDEIGFISDKKNGLANAYLATVNTSKKYDKFAFEIKKIAPLGQHTVFDLSTSNETYLCEGIVVHNCFVTAPPEDCWHNPDGVGMIENIANFGHIARRGGGCGVSFSGIRPEGDPVFGSTHAKACGPIEHMRMISEVMSSITQAGFRGMAMMGTLSVSHPDVLKFIVCKQRDRALRSFLKEDIFNHYEQIRDKTVDQLNIVLDKFLSNFNISVVATDNFMRAVEKDLDWDLRFNGKVYSTVKARQIFDLVVENAWKNGDPGLLFWDAMNRGPYQYSKQVIDATNPCVSGDTLVLTKTGARPIRELVAKPCQVLSYHNGKFIWTDTEGSFLSRSKTDVITIHTQNSKITCTPDHKILTTNGFKEGKDIVAGEMILSNPYGLGVSYGLETKNDALWPGNECEFPSVSGESSSREADSHQMVRRWVWVEEDCSDDLCLWLDLCSFEEIFSTGRRSQARTECCNSQNSSDEVAKGEGSQKSVLSLDRESPLRSQDQKIQLRLVSITDCGCSLLAKFIRMDNGDVLGFTTDTLEIRGKGLCAAQRRNIQTRLLHLLDKWRFREGNRSEEPIHTAAQRLQSGPVEEGMRYADRVGIRYSPVCPKSFELYREMPARMETVVRVTKDEPIDVFDLSTNHASHNFIANGLIVHNCGEQVLPSWGSCNLGSIDVAKFYDPETEEVDWPALREAIHVAVQFLDNVIEVNKFPTSEFKEWAFRNRPVGLGIMGFADLLLKLKIAYGCPTSIEFAEKLGAFFEKHAHQASLDLAHDRGTPECCKYDELGHRRNATTISIAPTGTISMLAGCQSSIEPFYAPTVMRYDNTGSYQMPHPDAERAYFRSAINENENKEVHWKQHIEIQAAFQKHCDSAISKTINMRKSATVEDVRDAYLMAWKRGCKGITIYRDGSKSAQVLNTKEKTPSRMRDTSAMPRPVKVPADIYKRSADGFEWHIIIGLVEGTPYEVFAVNGQQGDLPDHGYVIRKKSRYYTLTDTDNNVLIENIAEAEQELDPRISLETRRFSLELRYGIQLKYIVEQIDKSCAIINSFAKVINRVFKSQYLTQEELQSITQPCPWCAKNGRQIQLVNKAGCWQCPLEECGFAKCG